MLGLSKKNRQSPSDKAWVRRIDAFRLKNRVKQACQDTTDYELILRDFCEKYKHVHHLLEQVQEYRNELIERGINRVEAAKLTWEKFR